MQIVEICKEEDLKIIEQKYINLFTEDENITLLNIYKDSKSPKGHKYGEEVSNKKRDSMQGMFVGVPRSEETKLKLSKALSGKFNKCVKQICPITNNIINVYDSIKDACEATGASRNKLSCVLNNRMGKDKNGKPYRYLTTKGYKWEFC